MGPSPLTLSALKGNFVALHIFRINHFPKKRKRDEEEEGYSCAAQWRDGEIDDKGTRRELGERGRGRGGVRCGGAGHLGWGSRECFDYSPLKLLNPLMP